MARVQFGGGVTDIVGSIGGTTFSANVSGSIARRRGSGKRKSTPAQTLAHANLSIHQVGWQALSLAQQQSWNTFAAANDKTTRLGTTKTISGFNWYTMINSNLLAMGQAVVAVPPTYAAVTAATIEWAALITDNLIVQMDPLYSFTGKQVFIYATGIVRNVTRSFYSSVRFMGAYTPPASNQVNITAAWESAFGMDIAAALPAGRYHMGFMAVTVDETTGIPSAASFLTVSRNVPSGIFLPVDLPSCVCWLAADQAVWVGTINDIIQMEDLSGSGNDAIEAASGQGPVYNSISVNGLPSAGFTAPTPPALSALRCDSLASLLSGSDTPYSAYFVFTPAAIGTAMDIFAVSNAAGGTQRVRFSVSATGQLTITRRDDGGGTANQSSGIVFSAGVSYYVSIVFSGTTVSAWVNGVNAINAAAQNVAALTMDFGMIGDFNPVISSVPLHGTISEFILSSIADSTSDRQSIESYLASKYGL